MPTRKAELFNLRVQQGGAHHVQGAADRWHACREHSSNGLGWCLEQLVGAAGELTHRAQEKDRSNKDTIHKIVRAQCGCSAHHTDACAHTP